MEFDARRSETPTPLCCGSPRHGSPVISRHLRSCFVKCRANDKKCQEPSNKKNELIQVTLQTVRSKIQKKHNVKHCDETATAKSLRNLVNRHWSALPLAESPWVPCSSICLVPSGFGLPQKPPSDTYLKSVLTQTFRQQTDFALA